MKKTEKIWIRVTAEEKRYWKKVAKFHKQSMSAYVRKVMKAWFA